MAEDNINKVVIRTQVYLEDPEYFCNKSWTMSYNLNTQKWISFHSYIPNFYIGENNFFYSGLNGCCDDGLAGGFQAIAGVMDKNPPMTSTTTTYYPSPSTTTSTTTLDCGIDGRIIITDCNMDGTAIITVPATTTTTICQRPSNLQSNNFGTGYQVGTEPAVVSSNSLQDVCNAVSFLILQPLGVTVTGFSTQAASYEVNQIVYYDSTLTDCTFVPDGWYYTEESVYGKFAYRVSGGVILEIVDCDCNATTTSTTTAPYIDNCCTALISSGTNIYYHNLGQPMELLNVPNYTPGIGIAMTKNYLWSVDTEFHQWDITLIPFDATYNKNIAFPVGFTINSGITAKNDDVVIAVNDTTNEVVEINMDTEALTSIFTLITNRIAIGNLILTSNSKLLLINQDSMTSSYYLTQYDYPLGTIEYDIEITAITPANLYECNCWLFIVDTEGASWLLDKTNPYDLLPAETFTYNPISITQVSSCFSAEIPLTTTTTSSSSSTTTTTTTTP